MENSSKLKTRKQKNLLFFLFFIQICLVAGYIYYHNNYWSDEVLRVYYVDSERINSHMSPYGPGFEKELVGYFSETYGLKPLWIKVDSLLEGLDKLQAGKGNLLLTGPLAPDNSWSNVVRGPGYMKNRIVLAHNQWRYPLRSMSDLCSSDAVVPGRFVFSQKINELERRMECTIQVTNVMDAGQDFFNLLSNREHRFGLIDELNLSLWNGFYPEVHKTYSFDTEYEYAWLWSSRYKDMDKKFQEFWDNIADDPYFISLKDKYFGFFPLKSDSYQMRHFFRAIDRYLPLYKETIAQAAQEFNLDPILLVALIYQESHFDAEAESRTGVRGLVQLTLDTADFLGVSNRLDPDQSIMGGAKYLDFIMERVDETGAVGWDRWFFTLAAYNQGLGHLYDAMELAERKGVDSLSWAELKEIYPLLSYRKYFETLPRGYTRGFEAVNFVENIRYYYYLLYGMSSLLRPEAEHLGGLFVLAPGNWPD